MSASAGGLINLTLKSATSAKRPFVILGSTLGNSPCFAIGSVCVPFAIDPLFTLVLLTQGVAVNSISNFDVSGNASGFTFLSPGIAMAGVGLRFTYAWITTDVFNTTSQSAVIEIIP